MKHTVTDGLSIVVFSTCVVLVSYLPILRFVFGVGIFLSVLWMCHRLDQAENVVQKVRADVEALVTSKAQPLGIEEFNSPFEIGEGK